MKPEVPDMPRREFLETLAVKVPLWLAFATAVPRFVAEAASDDTPYDATKHLYAMGVDIDKCIGCARCVDACKTENHVPREPYFFRTWIERYLIPMNGDAIVDSPNGGLDGFPEVHSDVAIRRSFFVPKLCNHCANPPCVQVCPVGATFSSPDGVVLVDGEYCVGCRYCIQACPYGARYLDPVRKVADKCTFCYHRITKGGLPACVEVCPTGARIFGERNELSSPIQRFLRFNDVTVLKQWLNTAPKVFYANADMEVR